MPNLTLEDFVQMVKAMRANQRLYFKERSPTVLQSCKQLEREVDAAVHDILNPQQDFLE